MVPRQEDPDFVFQMLNTKYADKAEVRLVKHYEQEFHTMYPSTS